MIWLLTILHVGEQFGFAGLAVGFWLAACLLFSKQRAQVFKRIVIFSITSALITVPFLMAIWRASNSLGIEVKRNLESLNHHPDLVQFFAPTEFNRLLGPSVSNILRPVIISPAETAVFMAWTGLLLCVTVINLNKSPSL